MLHATASRPKLAGLWQCGDCKYGAFDAIEAAAAIAAEQASAASMQLLKSNVLST